MERENLFGGDDHCGVHRNCHSCVDDSGCRYCADEGFCSSTVCTGASTILREECDLSLSSGNAGRALMSGPNGAVRNNIIGTVVVGVFLVLFIVLLWWSISRRVALTKRRKEERAAAAAESSKIQQAYRSSQQPGDIPMAIPAGQAQYYNYQYPLQQQQQAGVQPYYGYQTYQGYPQYAPPMGYPSGAYPTEEVPPPIPYAPELPVEQGAPEQQRLGANATVDMFQPITPHPGEMTPPGGKQTPDQLVGTVPGGQPPQLGGPEAPKVNVVNNEALAQLRHKLGETEQSKDQMRDQIQILQAALRVQEAEKLMGGVKPRSPRLGATPPDASERSAERFARPNVDPEVPPPHTDQTARVSGDGISAPNTMHDQREDR